MEMKIKYLFVAIIIIVLVCIYHTRKSPFHNPFVNKKLEYKEERIVINDNVIDEGDAFQIIAPVWWSVSTFDGEEKYINDLKQFSIPQKYVFAIFCYRSEVNNGGHAQFYFNSSGIVWADALNGFGEIGLEDFQNVLKESIQRMGGNPSKDWDKRQKQLDDMLSTFEDLDKEFYRLEKEIDLDSVILKYINQNRDSFYFDGFVKKPVGWK